MLDVAFRLQGVCLRLKIPEKRVFIPNLVGLLDATQLRVRPGDVACDVGTGSGFLAILCAKLGASAVYGIDVSVDAIANARRNARLNGVERSCRFIAGSFETEFRRLGPTVDLLISTLPNTPAGSPLAREPAMLAASKVSRHLSGGARGSQLNIEMIRGAWRVLRRGARIQTHLVAWSDARGVVGELRRQGFRARTLARACVPVWGQRCNAASAYRARARGQTWILRYDELPADAACAVRVIEAAWGRRPARARGKAAEAAIRVLR